ncbi:MAG: hypothetical protein EKK29_05850 [Hyphomicrobiales bacterium]|nr:MAG: hypothetical protein EKK29_05850 [Hyphomicrobiales bacterium]
MRLAAILSVAWEHEKDLQAKEDKKEKYFAAVADSGRIVDMMIATPARTLSALRAKAGALHWCQMGRFEGICPTSRENVCRSSGPATTDMRLAESILFDLLAISNPTSAPDENGGAMAADKPAPFSPYDMALRQRDRLKGLSVLVEAAHLHAGSLHEAGEGLIQLLKDVAADAEELFEALRRDPA